MINQIPPLPWDLDKALTSNEYNYTRTGVITECRSIIFSRKAYCQTACQENNCFSTVIFNIMSIKLHMDPSKQPFTTFVQDDNVYKICTPLQISGSRVGVHCTYTEWCLCLLRGTVN